MSNEIVENIPKRLREEILSLGFSLSEASRKMGEKSPQRLKDVVNGRQKAPADLLSSAASIGVDIFYVLTGDRRSPVEKTVGSGDILDFGKRLDYLTSEFNALKHHHEVAETPSNFAKTNHLPLKDLLAFNTTARQELQTAIASVQEVVVEEGMLLTPEQFAGVVVGVLSDEEVHDCLKESKLM